MAINKKLIHFNTFENFNSKKLSANIENTKYTLGIDGEIQTGSPDILYLSIVYIKDTKQQWTHGLLYTSDDNYFETKEDALSKLQEAKSYTDNKTDDIKSELSKKQNTLVSGTNIKTVNGQSLLGNGDLEIQNFKTYTFEYDGSVAEKPITQEELSEILEANKIYIKYDSILTEVTVKKESDSYIVLKGYDNTGNYVKEYNILIYKNTLIFSISFDVIYLLTESDIEDLTSAIQYNEVFCPDIEDGLLLENLDILANRSKPIIIKVFAENIFKIFYLYSNAVDFDSGTLIFYGKYTDTSLLKAIYNYDDYTLTFNIIELSGNNIDLSNYYTKEEANAAFDVAGSAATAKSEAIEAFNQSIGSKQDTITDLEVIRQGAAKGATALQSIPSEYVTETELSNKGYATISALNNKVDVINGKQLSTEDFTTALKTKLEELNNYDDTELSNAIETLRGDFDKIVSGDTTTAIKTFNEVIAFLDGLTDTQDLESIIASIEQQIAGKADNNSVVHIAGEETITGIKTFNGRVNFLGSGDSNAMYLSTNTRLNVNGTTNTVLGFSSGTFLINNAAYNLTLRGKGTRPTYNSTTLALSSDIPTAITENTVSGWGFTKNTGTYNKPSTGIPKTDLASAVQTSLEKADTALQTETYKGTITGVSANGTSIATSGVANIPAASTSAYGVTKLSSVTNSTSTSLAATASAVKAAYDLANGKQNKLVSGTNIKTINGTSILGSGDIVISSGGSLSGNGAYALVEHGTNDTTFMLTPNTFHVWEEVTSLTLTFGEEESGVANEFLFQFESGNEATTLTLPDDLIWANDDIPVIESNYTYQVSILKGFAAIIKFGKKDNGLYFSIDGTKYQVEEGMTWTNWMDSEYNTDGYFKSGLGGAALIYNSDGTKNVYMSNEYVFGDDFIIPQVNYTTS